MKIYQMDKAGRQVNSKSGLMPDDVDALANEWCRPATPIVIVTREDMKEVYTVEWHPVPGQRDGTVIVHYTGTRV